MMSCFPTWVRLAALATVLLVRPAWIPAAYAGDEADAKSAATAVPEELADQGRVYYVQPSDRPQVTFTSRTPAEKFKGVSAKLVGYVVSSEKEGALPVEFVGGEFLYAVRVDTSQGFELCPADACRIDDDAAAVQARLARGPCLLTWAVSTSGD